MKRYNLINKDGEIESTLYIGSARQIKKVHDRALYNINDTSLEGYIFNTNYKFNMDINYGVCFCYHSTYFDKPQMLFCTPNKITEILLDAYKVEEVTLLC